MNKKRDLLSEILTWFLIITCVFSLWACGFLIGQKTREHVSSVPNVVLNEKKANDDLDLAFYTSNQSSVYCIFITNSSTTYPFQNIYSLKYNTYLYINMDKTTINNISGVFEITLSNSQRYLNNNNYYSFSYSTSALQTFDFDLDLDISLNELTSISILPYIDSIGSDTVDTTLEVYINDDYNSEFYFSYQYPISINSIFQYFDLGVNTQLVNKEIIDNYKFGYDDGYYHGYYDGKLDGYDEGYYDRDADYESTDGAFEMVWQFISNAFASVFNVLDIQLFAGIKLFHILAIPLIISVLYFVIKILAK